MSSEPALEGLQPAVGDPLPPAVETYLAAFSEGRAADSAAGFAADAVYARPSEPENEIAARDVSAGDLPAALAGDPALGTTHTVRLCVAEGSDCLLEGSLLAPDGAVESAFSASIQLDGAGSISRILIFRTQPIEDAVGTALGEASTNIQKAIDDYFVELDAARFESAVTFFSADGLYSHPPYSPGTPRVEPRGHDELLANFEKRGAQTWEHYTVASIQRGRHLLLEGYALIDGTREGRTGSFVSCATVDGDGKIARYVAYYCAPMVDRR